MPSVVDNDYRKIAQQIMDEDAAKTNTKEQVDKEAAGYKSVSGDQYFDIMDDPMSSAIAVLNGEISLNELPFEVGHPLDGGDMIVQDKAYFEEAKRMYEEITGEEPGGDASYMAIEAAARILELADEKEGAVDDEMRTSEQER